MKIICSNIIRIISVEKKKKIGPEYFKLKIFGIKLTGLLYLLDFKKAGSKTITPFFSVFEIIKMSNLLSTLTGVRSNENTGFFKNYLEKIRTIAFGFAELRMSKFIALEDVRMAFILIVESLKSSNLLKI